MSALHLNFENKSTHAQEYISVGFVSGKKDGKPIPISVVNRKTGKALKVVDDGWSHKGYAGNWYSLSDLTEGVDIKHFSGRIYVCYGKPWSVEQVGYEPAQAVTDKNFFLRYDKVELTFNGAPTDVANLTSIDYLSIPMSLQTSLSETIVETAHGLKGDRTFSGVVGALSSLTEPPVSGVVGPGGVDGMALPALVPGKFKQYPSGKEPETGFARVIGPSSYPPIDLNDTAKTAIPVMPYDIFKEYLEYLRDSFGPDTEPGEKIIGLGGGVIAHISGEFGGVGPNVPATGPQSRQSYDYEAKIDDDLNITLIEKEVKAGDTKHSMLFKFDDLINPAGIYGGNASFYFDGSHTSINPQNNVYGWICGDLFSGINIGAVGSETIKDDVMVGAMPSSEWFSLEEGEFFSALQPEQKNYNQWAATLAPCSDAYNFAYTDRFAHVFVSLDPAKIDTATVILLKDDSEKIK